MNSDYLAFVSDYGENIGDYVSDYLATMEPNGTGLLCRARETAPSAVVWAGNNGTKKTAWNTAVMVQGFIFRFKPFLCVRSINYTKTI